MGKGERQKVSARTQAANKVPAKSKPKTVTGNPGELVTIPINVLEGLFSGNPVGAAGGAIGTVLSSSGVKGPPNPITSAETGLGKDISSGISGGAKSFWDNIIVAPISGDFKKNKGKIVIGLLAAIILLGAGTHIFVSSGAYEKVTEAAKTAAAAA